MQSSAASRIQANLQDLFKANLSPGDSHIRFQLTSDITALLSMKQVQESLVIDAEKITTLPSMPESAIGIMSSRNRVFCVFDLAQLLGLPSPLGSPRQYQIIVLQNSSEPNIYIGFAVSKLQGIIRLSAEQIKSSLEGVSSQVIPYLCGTVEKSQTTNFILDFNRIVEAVISLKTTVE